MAEKDDDFTIVGVRELTDEEAQDYDLSKLPESGIVECVKYKHEDIPHHLLEELWEMNPEYVMEVRPDWVKANHPHTVN